MKTMKSYRMEDTILNMIDYIKEEMHLSTDTRAIEYGVMELFWKIKSEKPHEDT